MVRTWSCKKYADVLKHYYEGTVDGLMSLASGSNVWSFNRRPATEYLPETCSVSLVILPPADASPEEAAASSCYILIEITKELFIVKMNGEARHVFKNWTFDQWFLDIPLMLSLMSWRGPFQPSTALYPKLAPRPQKRLSKEPIPDRSSKSAAES